MGWSIFLVIRRWSEVEWNAVGVEFKVSNEDVAHVGLRCISDPGEV